MFSVYYGIKVDRAIIQPFFFYNDIEINLQGRDPEENPLPLHQFVYKVGN